jgi:Protein of unknown function (DUF3302)
MFLDYFALVILLIGLTLVFYTFIYIHDLPHKIAKKRHHPHEEAIHVACWLSLFTLHAIWPIVYIWSVTHMKPAEGASVSPEGAVAPPAAAGSTSDVTIRLARLEHRLKIVGILEADSN